MKAKSSVKKIKYATDLSEAKVGQYFKAKIHGDSVEGVLQFEDNSWFLCQNVKNGFEADNKLGYVYAWKVYDGAKNSLIENGVTKLVLLNKFKRDLKKVSLPAVIHLNRWMSMSRKKTCRKNGGSGLSEALYKIAGENYDDDDKKRHLRSTIDRMKCIANEALGL